MRVNRLPGAAREFVAALVLFCYVEWLLRRTSLTVAARRMQVSMTAGEPLTASDDPDVGATAARKRLPDWAVRRVRAVERVASWWPLGRSGPCLRSSLVVGRRLSALRPVLCLGVRRDATGLRGHAWVRVGDIELDIDPGDWTPLPIGDLP
jgi:hypothetical protein